METVNPARASLGSSQEARPVALVEDPKATPQVGAEEAEHHHGELHRLAIEQERNRPRSVSRVDLSQLECDFCPEGRNALCTVYILHPV